MGLRDKYAYAISQAKGKFDGGAEERDGKLYFTGSVKTENEKNEIWTAIKTIPDWKDEIVADIKVTGGPAAAAPAAAAGAAAAGPPVTLISATISFFQSGMVLIAVQISFFSFSVFTLPVK